MYKVTSYQFKLKLLGLGPDRAVEFEQYINNFAKEGYELINTLPMGMWLMCVWKKI